MGLCKSQATAYQIQNELRNTALYMTENYQTFKEQILKSLYAKT